MVRVLALFGVVFATGCSNPCADICAPMAEYARDCGMSVSAGDVKTCRDAHSGEVSTEQADVCREFSDPQKMREWWTCDDIAENMTGAQ